MKKRKKKNIINSDRNKILSVEEYLKISQYLKNTIINLKMPDTWKIQLTVANNIISSIGNDEERAMHSKSDKIEIMIKACVHYFLSNFYFSPNDSSSKTIKMFFISSRKLFSFSRYSSFVISVFPSFSPCQPLL